MDVDPGVEILRRLDRHSDQRRRTGDDLAQRQPGPYPVLGRPLPHELDIGLQGAIGRRSHRIREGLSLVDGRARQEAAYAGLERGAAHGFGVGSAGLGETRGADGNHVGVAGKRAQMDVVRIEHRLERDVVVFPDRDLDPLAARDLGDLAPQQMLGGVDVRVYQARHGDPARTVDGRARTEQPSAILVRARSSRCGCRRWRSRHRERPFRPRPGTRCPRRGSEGPRPGAADPSRDAIPDPPPGGGGRTIRPPFPCAGHAST